MIAGWRVGEAIAAVLAQHGVDVGMTYRSHEAGAEATAENVRAVGRRVEVRHLRLCRLPEAGDVVDQQVDPLQGLSVLVHCAGTGTSASVLETEYTQWRPVLAVDLDGRLPCAHAATRHVVASGRGGRIVNITSAQEHSPRVGIAAGARGSRVWR